MQKIIFSIGFFSCFSLTMPLAQPGELSSPLAFQYLLDNPAAVGLDGQHHLMLGAYQKWLGMEDAPASYYLASSHPFFNRALGIGGTIAQDRAALLHNTRASLNLAVHLNPVSAHRFSFGASARYQYMRFGAPNVMDPILSDEPGVGGLNLGLGLNYNYQNDDGMMFNLQAQAPFLPATLDLSQSGSSTEMLSYQMAQELVLQANLRYPLGKTGNHLTPSFRYQGQLGEMGNWGKTHILDLGLGVSFLDGLLDLRLGARTGRASLIYGGVGIAFGKGRHSNAYFMYEPGGPLGSSAALTADLAFGEEMTTNPRPPKQQACFRNAPCLEDRWASFNRRGYFEVKTKESTDGKLTSLSITFADNSMTQDYFKDPDFMAAIPLNKLIEAIDELYHKDLAPNQHTIIQLNFQAQIRYEPDETSYETCRGIDFPLDYWYFGINHRDTLRENDELTEGQLAALKLHHLSQAFLKRAPEALGESSGSLRHEIDHASQIDNDRYITITLLIK